MSQRLCNGRNLPPIVTFMTLCVSLAASVMPAQSEIRCHIRISPAKENAIDLIFSEPVSGLTRNDLTIRGGAASELLPQGGSFRSARVITVTLHPTQQRYIRSAKLRRVVEAGNIIVSMKRKRVRGRISRAWNGPCGEAIVRVTTPPEGVSPPLEPTTTPIPESSPTRHPPATATATAAPWPTGTATRTPTRTPTPTQTATPTATWTPTSVNKETQTATPTKTPTKMPTKPPTKTPTPVHTATPAATSTPATSQICSESFESGRKLLPAFPEALGHGRYSVGGSGRHRKTPCTTIYQVTHTGNSGSGSLRECIEAKGPRTCVFEIGGLFRITKDLQIKNPFITIAGQTAPWPGVNIRGASLAVSASEVIIQHIRMRVGDDPRHACCSSNSCSTEVAATCTSDPGSRDGIKIVASQGAIENIIIDHVSVAWALDEAFSIVPDKGEISNVTFSNSILAYGLDMSIHPEANNAGDLGHSKAVLINGSNSVRNLSFVRNLLAHNADRNIRASTNLSMEYINNVVYDWGRGGGAGRTIELANNIQAVHALDIIGNLYLPGPDTFCPETEYQPDRCFSGGNDGIDSAAERAKRHYMLRIGSGVSAFSSQSRYYLMDNVGPTRGPDAADQWDVADRSFFSKNSLIYPSHKSAGVTASSSSVTPVSSLDALDLVSNGAGCRPDERDSIDERAVTDVQTRTGRIINCVSDDGTERCSKNAGGWPTYTESHQPLAIPNNPTTLDGTGDGYTALENYLFDSTFD